MFTRVYLFDIYVKLKFNSFYNLSEGFHEEKMN